MTNTNSKQNVRALCEGALMVALGTVLGFIKLFELPQGGAVSLGMLPILFYAIRWGAGRGLLCGFVYGLLQLILDGAYAWGWASMLLDYIVAYTALGLGGIFAGKSWGVYVGTVVGSLARFVVHFISGITIYKIVVPTAVLGTTFDNPYLYSAAYNGSYVGIDMVFCLIIFALLYKPLKKYFLGEDICRK